MMIKNILLAIISVLFLSDVAFAQYYSFGKNRVQYTEYNWRFIQTEHFDIYYSDAKNYPLAEFAAMSVESAYKQLSKDFNHEISDRIPLIIYASHNDFSQTNVVALPISAEGIGGVTDKLKNRMTVPFNGEYNDFRRVIHHELVHAVFNDMFYGGTIQSIIQNNIQLVFPLWFEEGLAEYMALGWDTNTDTFIRDAVLNNYLPPILQLGGYFSYRGGQSLWNFIAEEYGREKIAEILNRIKTTRSVELGLTQSLGLNINELSKRWQESLKVRYFPEVAERERLDVVATQLTRRGDFGTYNTSPAISPQGDRIAFITNKRGYFDVVVISAIDGSKLKTLIRGEDNPEFEELNILNPNLTWSPDGRKIALSTKAKGRDDIGIIDYVSGEVEKIKFPLIDAIGSVAWSPDGKKIAFDGNIGPFQDIFVYNLESKKLTNLTQDFYSDLQPNWSADSKTVYFISDRGSDLSTENKNFNQSLLLSESLYQTDIYAFETESSRIVRLTNTPNWNERQPFVSRNNRMVFISDQNGIQNLYELNLDTRTSKALSNIQSGVSQISMSADGSRVAINSVNEGYLDIYLLKNPFTQIKEEAPSLNYWAQRRQNETEAQRVPAVAIAKEMYSDGLKQSSEEDVIEETFENSLDEEEVVGEVKSSEIDFRNYVFSEEVIKDTTLVLEDIQRFNVLNNITENGQFSPLKYRLNFSVDIAYNPTFVASTYGSNAQTQIIMSDLLGDHQIAVGTNFVFDLRNSDYSFQYGNFKNRTNYLFNYFHTSRSYQTFNGDLVRFRTFGGGITSQYPIDKFKRFDFNLSMLGVVLDYNNIFQPVGAAGGNTFFGGLPPRQSSSFLYPEIVFTNDRTLPGFITPQGGTRYSVGISGSPGLGSSAPQFASALADFRHYFNLGYNYSFAVRGSFGASLGEDSQSYILGGKLGWINQRFSNNGVPLERLTDSFFTVPALPMRGYEYNTLYGDKFGLINAEFRFPLVAALIPGAFPILPLYNITGLAFLDVGTAWGQDINLNILSQPNINSPLVRNSASLDFTVAKERNGFVPNGQGGFFEVPYVDGDVLMGAGFGLRTILLGLPFGWDVGWAYDRTGFKPKPIHYFTIGIDF